MNYDKITVGKVCEFGIYSKPGPGPGIHVKPGPCPGIDGKPGPGPDKDGKPGLLGDIEAPCFRLDRQERR